MSAMCTCAQGCDRNSLADPGVFPPCSCWCHEQTVLTLEQIQVVLAAVTYKPGWTVTAFAGEFEGPWLCIRALLKDAYRPGSCTVVDVNSPIPPMEDGRQFLRWLCWRLQRIEVHECREWLRVDGSPIFDPHAEHANFPADHHEPQVAAS